MHRDNEPAMKPPPPTRTEIISALSGLAATGITLRPGIDGVRIGFLVPETVSEAQCRAAEIRIRSMNGVESVTAVRTGESVAAPASSAPSPTPARPAVSTPARPAQWNRTPIPGVARIIAVASGKGGVGKSTIAALLAHALRAEGHRVGLLDADIYGPSQARMFALSGQPEAMDGKLHPMLGTGGVPVLSMGSLVGEGDALIWRGPQLSKTLAQLLRGAGWAGCYDGQGLQTLLIDMPPGTGDVALSLAQQAPIDGAILVTIPSHVAVMDAAKSAAMFKKLDIPLLGIVENMAGLMVNGALTPLFGTGGGAALAARTDAPLLASLPLWQELGPLLDGGKPPTAMIYESIQMLVSAIGIFTKR